MTDHMNPPEAEFKLGKPYIIPADARNRFMEYANDALDKARRETWERFEEVLTMFPVEKSSEPTPDREHTCHDHCPCQLRERVARAIAAAEGYDVDDPGWRHLASDLRTEFEHHADAALAVVQPELDRHIGAHRRDNQRHANTAQVLRSELADMTIRRDLNHEYWQNNVQYVGDLRWMCQDALGVERDRHSRVESLIEKIVVRAEAAEAELAEWKQAAEAEADLEDESQASVRRIRAERDGLREELKAQRIVTAVTRQERDEARWERDGKQAQLDSQEQKLAQTRADRDELQGRINEIARYWRDWQQSKRNAVRQLSRFVFQAIENAVNAPPADDSSEADVPPGLNPMAEDSGEPREHQHGQMNGCDATCAADAENESPPFKVGDYVRDKQTGRAWRASKNDVARTWQWWTIERWTPKPGERVTGEAYDGTHTGVYLPDYHRETAPARCVAVDSRSPNPPTWVLRSSLRPAGGGEA